MFRYTDLKYILLALLSAFAAAGPILGLLILAILHGDTPPAKEFRFPLTVFGAFAVWVFPFLSFLLSSALIVMLLRSSEKIWKKILLTLLLLPLYWRTCPCCQMALTELFR